MLELIRFCDHSLDTGANSPMGCLGELFIDDVFTCYTIEQPWRNNLPFKSCVPVGDYSVIPYSSPKYGQVVAITNGDNVVAYKHEAKDGDRYACLFHPANWASQLEGCIAVGENLAWGQRRGGHKPNLMVTNSRNTLKKILPQLINQRLRIRWKHA